MQAECRSTLSLVLILTLALTLTLTRRASKGHEARLKGGSVPTPPYPYPFPYPYPEPKHLGQREVGDGRLAQRSGWLGGVTPLPEPMVRVARPVAGGLEVRRVVGVGRGVLVHG